MASLNTILSWFKKGLKPTEDQFSQSWSSFRHKDDAIILSDVSGLTDALNRKIELGADGQLPWSFFPYKPTIISVIPEGGTINIDADKNYLIIDTAVTILNCAIKLPANPVDHQELTILFGGQISSIGKMIVNQLTIDGNGNAIVNSGDPSVIRSGDSISLRFINNYWREI